MDLEDGAHEDTCRIDLTLGSVRAALLVLIAAIIAPLPAWCATPDASGAVPAVNADAPEHSIWTPVERWAWERFAGGQPIRLSGPCPAWRDEQPPPAEEDASTYTLSGGFVARVLGQASAEPSRTMSPVEIRGARIVGDVVLEGGRTDAPVKIACSSVVGTMRFQDWEFLGGVELSRVALADTVYFYDVDARYLIALVDSDFEGVHVLRSRFGRDFSLRATRVRTELKVVSTEVRGSLLMGCDVEKTDRCGRYGQTELIDVRTTWGLDAVGGRFDDKVLIDGAEVGSRVNLHRARFVHLEIRDTDIGGGIDLRRSGQRLLDLSGTTVRRSLDLGAQTDTVDWGNPDSGARFIARNTRVGSLRHVEQSWPVWLEAEFGGFEYASLIDVDQEDVEWLKGWLARDGSYSPQPYTHLSDVLRRQGQRAGANEILYAARDRERSALPWYCPERWWLEAQRWSIGYGIGLNAFSALGWMILFCSVGWCVGVRSTRRCPVGRWRLLWHSVSYTVPGFNRDAYNEVTMSSRAKQWFYCQRLLCYALALLAGAAAVGLVQP